MHSGAETGISEVVTCIHLRINHRLKVRANLPPCVDALREAEAEPAVRVADLDEMMTLIDNA